MEFFGARFEMYLRRSSPELNEWFDSELERLEAESAIPSSELWDNLAEHFLERMRSDKEWMLGEEGDELALTRTEVRETWGAAIDELVMLRRVALESAQQFHGVYGNDSDAEGYPTFLAVIGLHARACQICMEIIVLLSAGLADGAEARWRTLHEVSAVGTFISVHGPEVAKRYLDFQVVELSEQLISNAICGPKLGFACPTQEEISLVEDEVEALKRQYGSDFAKQYGWAANALGKRQVFFPDIEKDAQLDHLRAFYKMACGNIHGGPKGTFNKLGSKEVQLVTGGSVYGQADIGQLTAMSMIDITAALVTLESSLDSWLVLSILDKMGRSVVGRFMDALDSLNGEDRE